MAVRKLGKLGLYFHCSSSIVNWKEKIRNYFQLPEWNYDPRKNVIFFGMYHWIDYLKFLWCRGKKIIYWGGSDILNLEKFPNRWMTLIFRNYLNIVETPQEKVKLTMLGIENAVVISLFWGDVEKYKGGRNLLLKEVQCWTCIRPGSEEKYGINLIEFLAYCFPDYKFHIYGLGEDYALRYEKYPKNIIFHGNVPEEVMDREIANYDVAIRLVDFDGLSEVKAKGMLLDQTVLELPYLLTMHLLKVGEAKKKGKFFLPYKGIKKAFKKNKEIFIKWIEECLNEKR